MTHIFITSPVSITKVTITYLYHLINIILIPMSHPTHIVTIYYDIITSLIYRQPTYFSDHNHIFSQFSLITQPHHPKHNILSISTQYLIHLVRPKEPGARTRTSKARQRGDGYPGSYLRLVVYIAYQFS